MQQSLMRRWGPYVFWALPGWIGILSLVVMDVTSASSTGWMWQLANRGYFVNVITPITGIFLLFELRRVRPTSAREWVVAIILALPTAIAMVGAVMFLLQTFVGPIG